MWLVASKLYLSVLFCSGLVASLCPPGSHNTRYYRSRCSSYDNALLKTWDEANQYCTERKGRLLRLETSSVFSGLRYGIPYVSNVSPDTPAVWIGGFTTNYTMLPNPPPTTVPTITTDTSGNSTNGTSSDVFNPFRLDSAADWFWTNGSSGPSSGLTGADHADDEYMNHNLATNGTGPCLGADRYRFYPQNCSTRAKFVCEYNCTQNITSSNATTIHSPNYPGSYPSNVFCEWYIDVQQGRAILEFGRFHLEGSCSYDSLKIYEKKGDSNYLSMQCGTSVPGRIVSNSSTMYIAFSTDGSGQYPGFTGTVRSSTVAVVMTYNDTHGLITTPDYPDIYEADSSFYWLINTGGVINLLFTDFDLQSSTNCANDFLQVREGSQTGRVVGTYCGNNLPANISSQTGVLFLNFTTDGSIQMTGFRAIYWSSSLPCFKIVNHGFGVLTTPNYPSAYTDGECVWYVDVGEGIAKIAIDRINTTSYSSSCSVSQIEVYDARLRSSSIYSTSNRLGIYCGSSRPSKLRSTSRFLMIKFSSTGGYRSSDFSKMKATFRSSTNCSQVIVATNGTGVVTSPDYPSYYDPYTNCTWLIDVRAGNLTLKFNTFSLQSHSTCFYDKFEAYDGNSLGNASLGSFCGYNNPPQIKTSGRYLLLHMTSDGTTSSRGFSAEFWSSSVNCTHWGITNVVTKIFNGTCFGFLKSSKSWTNARTFCEQRNSSLVRFETEAKFNAIKEWVFGELGYTAVWTAGYRRTVGTSNWFWSTLHGDQHIKDGNENSLWSSYKPTNSTNYVYMSIAGLNDVPGYSSYYTLCEEHIPVLLPGEVTDRPLRSCSPPPNIKAGFYSPPNVNYEDGANVTFSCDNYYNLTGNATITCRRGLWHPHVPVCRPQHSFRRRTTPSPTPADCRPPPSIHYGSFVPSSTSYTHGSTITVTCSPGYKLQGDGSLVCFDSHWQGFLSACVKEGGKDDGDNGNDDRKGNDAATSAQKQNQGAGSSPKGNKGLVAGTVSVIIILLVVIVALVVREVLQRKRRKHAQLLMEMD